MIAERGPTDRLAQAFHALVPDVERQRQLLSIAQTDVAASELGQEAAFQDLWQKVEAMLTSYSDEKFVSDAYARELSGARARAVDVEASSDDPPERVAVWLGSVADASLRTLDTLLLADLLRIEEDGARWRDVAETVITHAEDLVRVGYFDQAVHLAEAVTTEGAAGRGAERAGARRARSARPRRDDAPRRQADAHRRRRQLRAAEAAGARHRPRRHRAARRGAVGGAGRAIAAAAAATSWCSSARPAASRCSS